MDQENRLEEYKQKLRAFWIKTCERCGELRQKGQDHLQKFDDFSREKSEQLDEILDHYTDKLSAVLGKGIAFLKRHGAVLAQKLDPYLRKLKAALKKAAASLRRHCKRLLQMLALLLLKCRDYVQMGLAKVKTWLTPVVEQLPKPRIPDVPEEPEAPVQLAEPVAETPVKPQPPEKEPEPHYPDFLPENVQAGLMKIDPYVRKVGAVLAAIGRVISLIIQWIWRLRAIIISIPVVWAAIKLAMDNMDRLPEMVGLDIQSTGEFARMVSRTDAVYWPLGITLFCVLLTVCSKKPLLPWVISIFTLVLPLLIWFTNYYA